MKWGCPADTKYLTVESFIAEALIFGNIYSKLMLFN